MGLFDRWFGKPSKDQFARLMLNAIREAGEKTDLQYDASQFRLVSQSEVAVMFNLHNAYREYCAAEKDKRPQVVRRFTRSWFAGFKGIPDEFEDVRPDLLPVIRSRSYFELIRF